MKYKITNNLLKVVMILLFSCLSFLALIINSNPMNQFDVSLYAQIPDLGWILIFLILFGCFGVMLLTFNLRLKKVYHILSLSLIILLNIILINIPNILGYKYNGGGDILTHLGQAISILKIGSASGNFYPLTHILIANINIISSTNLDTIINNIGSLFYILFVLSSYVLAKEILNKKIAIFVAFASTVLFFTYYYAVFPMGYTFILFLLTFYLYFKYSEKKTPEIAITLILLSILLVFFHPVAAFFLTISLLTCEIGEKIYFRYYIGNNKDILNNELSNNTIKILYSIPLIVFISLFAWFWQNTRIWVKFVNSIIDLFTVELATKPLTDVATENFSTLGLSHIDIIFLFIKMYGHVIIFGILFLMVLIWILKRNPLGKLNNYTNLFKISFLMVIMSGIAIIDLIQPLTDLSSGRLINIPLTILPFFAGLALYTILSHRFKIRKNSTKLLSIIVLTIFLTSSIIGVISLYPSPITYRATPSLTSEQFDGVKWLIDHYNPGMNNIKLNSEKMPRILDASYGILENRSYIDKIKTIQIPEHFNYTNQEYFGENFGKDGYLTTREKVILSIYKKVYPQLNRFTEKDFIMLKQDSTVNKIYENGELENWYVQTNQI